MRLTLLIFMFVITGCFQSPLSKTLLPLLSAILVDAAEFSAILVDAAKQRLHVWWKEIRCAAATFLLKEKQIIIMKRKIQARVLPEEREARIQVAGWWRRPRGSST